MKKFLKPAVIFFTSLSLVSLTTLTGCNEKSPVPQKQNFTFEEVLLANNAQSKFNSTINKNMTLVTLYNKIENPISVILITEKGKKTSYESVHILKGQSHQFTVSRNTQYKIEVIDSRNHLYSKVTSPSGDHNEYFNFETESAVLEFKDRDFKPSSTKDNLLKFFGM